MRCKDIADKYGVTAMQVGRLRAKQFPDEKGDLTEDSAAWLTAYLEEMEDYEGRKETEEAVKPQFVDAFCTYVQRGRYEVECKIRLEDGGVGTVRALIPHKVDPIQLHFKPMRLEVIEYEGEKFYRHASLAGKAWEQRHLTSGAAS